MVIKTPVATPHLKIAIDFYQSFNLIMVWVIECSNVMEQTICQSLLLSV